MNELLLKLGLRVKHLKGKGTRVNMVRTKIIIRHQNIHSLTDSGKQPSGVSLKGTGSNSIFCPGYHSWIQKVVSKLI